MTHDELVQRAVKWLRASKQRCKIVFAEITTYVGTTPDALGINTSGVSTLVECKVSRSDFQRDFKKLGHRIERHAIGDYRWYLTPPGLLKPEEIPENWGLIEAHPKSVRVVVQAPCVQRSPHSRPETMILVSAVRRHQLGVPWDQETAKFESYAKHRHLVRKRRRRR